MVFDPISAGMAGGGILSSAAGNIFGSMAAGEGIEDALKVLEEMYGKAQEEIGLSHRFAKKRYKEIEGQYEPYRMAGLDALKKLVSTLSMPAGGSPLYQWRTTQGNRAIDQAMASRGLYGSDASIRARSDLNQNLTGEETDKLYGRIQNAVQLLGHYGTAGTAGAKSGLISSRWQKGQGLSDLYTQLGQLMSGLKMEAGANKGGLYSSLGSLPMQGLGMYSILNQGGMFGG